MPLDRTPFPLPQDATFAMYFTIQPGGAYVHTPGPITGGWLVYPNLRHSRTEEFFNTTTKGGGMGTVTPTQVLPDPKVRLYAFTGASFNDGNTPPDAGPKPGDCCANDGDPVNLATGIFTYSMTDLVVPDVIPLAVTRTYNSRDPEPRPFGTGMTHAYAIFQFSELYWEEADLILPDGGKIHYVRVSQQGLPWYQTIFEHTASPTAFYKSRIAWNGSGWDLTLKDGTVYVFGHEAPLQAIRDRHGNTVRFTWSTTNLFGAGTGIGVLGQRCRSSAVCPSVWGRGSELHRPNYWWPSLSRQSRKNGALRSYTSGCTRQRRAGSVFIERLITPLRVSRRSLAGQDEMRNAWWA